MSGVRDMSNASLSTGVSLARSGDVVLALQGVVILWVASVSSHVTDTSGDSAMSGIRDMSNASLSTGASSARSGDVVGGMCS